jgi:hypothetical protein
LRLVKLRCGHVSVVLLAAILAVAKHRPGTAEVQGSVALVQLCLASAALSGILHREPKWFGAAVSPHDFPSIPIVQ